MFTRVLFLQEACSMHNMHLCGLRPWRPQTHVWVFTVALGAVSVYCSHHSLQKTTGLQARHANSNTASSHLTKAHQYQPANKAIPRRCCSRYGGGPCALPWLDHAAQTCVHLHNGIKQDKQDQQQPCCIIVNRHAPVVKQLVSIRATDRHAHK